MIDGMRRATITDATAIHSLVTAFARDDLMLPRPLGEVYETMRDFVVCERDGAIAGCGATHTVWKDLAELRSVAVARDHQGQGIGGAIVEACIAEARSLGVARAFALTYIPGFFARFGFKEVSKEDLPHKIWADCLRCPKFPDCDEIAVALEL